MAANITTRRVNLSVLLRGPRVSDLSIRLPWPPSANNLYAIVGRRKILSKRGRDYHAAAAALCRNLGHMEGRLALEIDVYPPDKRQRDIANIEKAVVDSLVACGLFRDDSDIDRLTLQRKSVMANGMVVVRVSQIR